MRTFLSAVVFFLIVGRAASADVAYTVTLDTQSLGASAAGPFSLGFELAQGDQSYGNTAVISNFSFGTGSANGSPTFALGTVTGSLSGSVQMMDGSPITFFSQQFVPGNALSFTLRLGTNVASGGIPDALTVYLLDSTNTPIPTTAGAGSDYLLILNAAGDPDIQAYAGDISRAPSGGGGPLAVSVTATASAPEPQTVSLITLSILLRSAQLLRRKGTGQSKAFRE